MRLAIATVALVGCAHGTLSPANSVGPIRLHGKVALVTVSLADSVPTDRRARYDELRGNELIARAIVDRMTSHGVYDPAGDVRIEVEVATFRLRSATNAFMNGLLAGIDMLEGEVIARQGTADPARFLFKLSGAEDEYLKFSAEARFRSLARVLAEKVTALVDDGARAGGHASE